MVFGLTNLAGMCLGVPWVTNIPNSAASVGNRAPPHGASDEHGASASFPRRGDGARRRARTRRASDAECSSIAMYLTWAIPARTAKVSIGCIAKCPLARQESAIVSWNPSRASQAGRIRFRAGAGVLALRGGVSLLLVIGLLLVSGACGQNVQTNRPVHARLRA